MGVQALIYLNLNLSTVVLFLLLSGISEEKFNTHLQNNHPKHNLIGVLIEVNNMNEVFSTAIESKGETYLGAEEQLRQGGASAISVLSQNRSHKDPIAQLIAETLMAWIQGNAPEYQAALDYLDYIPKRVASTPIKVPRPIGVANDLNERFDHRAADFLALRLVKEEEWPRWCVIGVLFYLKEQKLSSTTSALLRFVIETRSDEARGYAIEAIQAINDPDLQVKISIEKERLDSLRKSLPSELESLVR